MCDFVDPLPEYARFEDEDREGPFERARHLAFHLNQFGETWPSLVADTPDDDGVNPPKMMAKGIDTVSERVRAVVLADEDGMDAALLPMALDLAVGLTTVADPGMASIWSFLDRRTSEILELPTAAQVTEWSVGGGQ